MASGSRRKSRIVAFQTLFEAETGRRDPYDVDRVPYVLYFHDDEALHAAYWHDGFGTPASHGCVNLSLADARWLFDWAPPRLPPGWNVVEANAGDPAALWVLIETRTPLPATAAVNPPVGASHSIVYSAVRALKPKASNAR